MALPRTLGSSQVAFPRAASASSACSIVRRRDHRQQTAAIIVANRKRPASAVAAVSGSYRWASQMKAIRRTNPAVTIPNTTARSAQTKRPELRPVLARARSARYFRQPPIQRFLPGLTCPHGPEQKTKRQRQSQRRIGALLQGFVDRVGHIVADFADRLDCFPSFVLGVRDDTSDTFARAAMARSFHGIVCCKRNVDTKVPRGAAVRPMLTSFLARVACELPGGPKATRPVMPPALRRRG